MALALENQMPLVASFESYPFVAPGSIGGLFIDRCLQNNIISWNTASTAEHYQVLRSYNSAFTNPEVVAFTTQPSVNVRVHSQGTTKYVKIRACNGNGCGSYSAQVALTYNSGSCN